MIELCMVPRCYGRSIGDPEYDPNVDIDCNGKIDTIDLWTATKSYSQPKLYPPLLSVPYANFRQKDRSINKIALGNEETFKEVGFDPAYKSLLIYYPLEVGEQTIENTP
jgi:hypothetical protein